jgi:hypothetical protein
MEVVDRALFPGHVAEPGRILRARARDGRPSEDLLRVRIADHVRGKVRGQARYLSAVVPVLMIWWAYAGPTGKLTQSPARKGTVSVPRRSVPVPSRTNTASSFAQ